MVGPFTFVAHAPKRDIDNRFSLKFYFRAADNVLRQARIYREEENIVDCYILLLRFSSLVGETIPEHQHYGHFSVTEKTAYRKKLFEVLTELEALKPEVVKKVEQINKSLHTSSFPSKDYEWPPVSKANEIQATANNFHNNSLYELKGRPQDLLTNNSAKQLGNQTTDLYKAFNVPLPKEETLLRHSLLGPNGLRKQWSTPTTQMKVQYPSYIDASPVDIPSLEQKWETALTMDVPSGPSVSNPEAADLNPLAELDIRIPEALGAPSITDVAPLRQPSPPPIAVPVQTVPIPTSESSPWDVVGKDSEPDMMEDKGPKGVHISIHMMEEFLKFAKSNTKKNIETCAVLAGSLKKGIFCVSTLVIPKQKATSDTCQTLNEEEIFEFQDSRGLFQLGWIHTHPTQSCFMSSVDLHTHYSYQVMLPEAIAIVMAPRDESRKYGIFRLSEPGGVKVIRQCDKRGFHAHEGPANGGHIYERCSHVHLNPQLRCEIADLR